MKKILIGTLLLSALIFKFPLSADQQQWDSFNCPEKNFKVAFPQSPRHLSNTINKGEVEEILYDMYISVEHPSVYMVLVAQYPNSVSEENTLPVLESFLNGLLSQNSQNKLLEASLVKVQNCAAIDFLIGTDSVLFKARMMISGNKLYLLAIESDESKYNEQQVNFFINNFQLTDR